MKFFQAAAVAASLFSPFISAFTSEELSAIAAGEQPGRTEVYVQRMRVAQKQTLNGVDRSTWTATADSFQQGYPPSNAIDSNPNSFWQTQRNPSVTRYPHNITIDMKQNYWVSGVTYLPRQDGSVAGTVGRHFIELSTDGVNYGTPKAFGLWHDDNALKTANFSATQARYLRLRALSEAGSQFAYTTAADINVYTVASTYSPPDPSVQGAYGPTIGFPTVLVAATVLHGSGKIMGWSSYLWDQFTPVQPHGTTWTTTYDPATGIVSDAVISNTQHDMFCPGLSRDAQGRAIVTGGSNSYAVSRYDDDTQAWTAMPKLTTPRGYQGQCTLSDGRVFTIGGSFSGGQRLKNGEVYSPITNSWKALSGCDVRPMLTHDSAGIYRADNHAWLFGWRNGSAFQAGPSKAMNWYGTNGAGTTTPAGNRGNDGDAMNGNAAMYDAVQGLILATGGAPDYQNISATSNANIIQIGQVGAKAKVTQVANMAYPRSFANSVIFPNGQVMVVGGQSYPQVFTDTTPVMTPELFDPSTNKFTPLAPIATVRTYHSIALLLPDASVLIGGGGLCGNCSTNHFDAQIYYPPYFYASGGGASTRPVIQSISGTNFAVGAKITLTTSMPVDQISLLRYGSATHAINTDQRRVPLTPQNTGGNTYTVTIPNDTGIMTPGAWMVFANVNGVPSVSKTIMVTN